MIAFICRARSRVSVRIKRWSAFRVVVKIAELDQARCEQLPRRLIIGKSRAIEEAGAPDLIFVEYPDSLLSGVELGDFVPADVRAGGEPHDHGPRLVCSFDHVVDLDDSLPPERVVLADRALLRRGLAGGRQGPSGGRLSGQADLGNSPAYDDVRPRRSGPSDRARPGPSRVPVPMRSRPQQPRRVARVSARSNGRPVPLQTASHWCRRSLVAPP